MSGSDKTEAPTPKRKREARRDGRIAKSPELSTWGTVLLASFVLPLGLGRAGAAVTDLLHRTTAAIADPDPQAAVGLLGAGGRAVLSGVLPIAVAMAAFALAANLAQSGLVVSTKKLKPSAERLNPIKGFKRLFSVESAWNTVKVLVRTLVLAGAAWIPLRSAIAALGAAGQPPLRTLIASVGDRGLQMVRLVAVAGLLLGVVDYAVVRRRLAKSLRMTKQEVRDEHRLSEGDPMVRSQIRARQREMSRNRMIAAVGDASVVIVNPTHVAVALRYEPGGGAPRLVAKGRGEVARRIREEAERHGVAMVRDVPLARALHDACDVDQAVPAELYEAVARVLAFVLTVGRRAAAIGGVLVAR